MKNRWCYLPIIVTAFLIFLGCSKDEGTSQEAVGATSRAFYMGFTAFPFADSSEAYNENLTNVQKDGDLFLSHLDFGVPWDEVFNDEPFPTNVQNELAIAKLQKADGAKLVLTTTALDQTRENLALYWNNNGTHQPLPTFWANKTFNDPDVDDTYTQYCIRLIDEVQPDYFGYGIEANAVFRKDDDAFSEYIALSASVYSALKTKYPNLPIFLSVQDQSAKNTPSELLETTGMLLQYSDYVAISTYPFLDYKDLDRDADPSLFSDSWLSDIRSLAPNKPFAVAETGFVAENLEIPSLGVHIKGTEAWQKEYLQKLMEHLNGLDAEFVAWFVHRDYDLLYNNMASPPDVLKIWKDTGLLDGDGNLRPAHTLWREWLALPKN